MQLNSLRKRNGIDANGYTLIELAFVILVVGVAFAVFGMLYKVNVKQGAIKNTEMAINVAASAIADFRAINSRYPCPASLTLHRGDTQYGHEGDCSDLSIGAGSCQNGVCIQIGNAIHIDPITQAKTNVPTRVRIGALPFRELNLHEEDSLDGYGNRLQYVVTEPLTKQATFDVTQGAIDVIDSQGRSVLNPAGTAQFVLVSFGPDGSGAYNRGGLLQGACVANTLEYNNCANGKQSAAIYRDMARGTSGGASQFDDFVNYYALGDVSPWMLAQDDTHNIYFKDLSSAGNIGFSVNPTSGQRGQVNGNVRARLNLQAATICDTDTTSPGCVPAQNIGGDLSKNPGGTNQNGEGLKCGPGFFMSAIANGVAVCVQNLVFNCPANSVMSGIQADGQPICSKLCPATSVNLCSSSYGLPLGNQDDQSTISADANFKDTFKCTDGAWVSQSSSGSCNCTTTTQTKGQACAAGLNGTITLQRTQQCPSGTWTDYVQIANTCTCVGGEKTTTVNCPTNYDGIITQKSTFICDTSTSGHYSNPVTVSNTCQCNNKTKTQTLNCPQGYTGSIVQSATLTCPAGTYGPWTQVSNTCKCVPGQAATRTINCPAGQIGSIQQQQTLQCPSGTWTDWVNISNTCQPQPPVVCHWAPSATGATGTSPAGSAIGSTCQTCNSKGPCYLNLGAGVFRNFGGCNCE